MGTESNLRSSISLADLGNRIQLTRGADNGGIWYRRRRTNRRNRIGGREGGVTSETTNLLGVVEALHVVLPEEGAVGRLAAAAHAPAEVQPEVVAPAHVPIGSPPRRHRLLPPRRRCLLDRTTLCPALPCLLVPLSLFSLRSGLQAVGCQ
jgi:hypothetical protein